MKNTVKPIEKVMKNEMTRMKSNETTKKNNKK